MTCFVSSGAQNDNSVSRSIDQPSARRTRSVVCDAVAVEMPLSFDSSSVLEFHGDSFVQLKLSNNVAKTFAYDVWFLPTKPNGQLLYRQFFRLTVWRDSVAEWSACWTQAQNGPGSNRGRDASLRQTVHTHCASVHQAAKLGAALALKSCGGNCGPGGK